MFQFCGKRMRVFKRAHKTCDTIHNSGGRAMHAAVHLEHARCDGASYGGCGAACMIFWKEAWLKRVDQPASGNGYTRASSGCTERGVHAGTLSPESTPEDVRYACQATDLLAATAPLPWWDARQYVEDLLSGNVAVSEMVGGIGFIASRSIINRLGARFGIREELIEAYDTIQKWRGGVPYPRKVGRVPAGQKTPLVQLGLRPGEKACIRSYEQILNTLDANNKTRGMFFDAEEVPYCGQTHEVKSRVNQIVDEKTGRLIPIKGGGAVIFDDVWCQGHYSKHRMFCPRAVHPFFREAWLERVGEPGFEEPPMSMGPETVVSPRQRH
jgi:hypothetical protein